MDFEETIKGMPKNLSKMEKARYLYIELGKYYCYDEKYFTSKTEEEKEAIINLKPENLKGKNVICTSLSRKFEEILNRAGVNAKYAMRENNGKLQHAFIEMEIDGELYCMDLIHDLMNIKAGFETKDFCTNDGDGRYKALSKEEISKIDKKIGYKHQGDEEVKRLREKISSIHNFDGEKYDEDSIKKAIDIVARFSEKKDMQFLERKDYFFELMKRIIDMEHAKKVYDFEKPITCVGKNMDLNIFQILQPKDGEKAPTIYLFPNQGKIKKINREEIRKEFNGGMQTLSEKNRQLYTQMLLGEFSIDDIGKNTIKEIPTIKRDDANSRVNADVKDTSKDKKEIKD